MANNVENLNIILDEFNNKDINDDFNKAVELSTSQLSYDEIFAFLDKGTDVEKQLAVLELDEIKSSEEALLLVKNLVGQDGKIREVVAFKVNELFLNKKFQEYFINEECFEIFLQGIMDINGNICRMVVDLSRVSEFATYLARQLPSRIKEILKIIETLEKDEKQFKVSKRNFQLYWSLETLYNIVDFIDSQSILDILLVTYNFEDYTIREKTAKILSKIDNQSFLPLKEKLKNDENYYVRRYL